LVSPSENVLAIALDRRMAGALAYKFIASEEK